MAIKISPTGEKAIQNAALDVWNHIGADVLQAVAEDTGKHINAVTIPRAHVIELVMDCERLKEELKSNKEMTPEVEKLFPATYNPEATKKLHKILKAAFPDRRYGM